VRLGATLANLVAAALDVTALQRTVGETLELRDRYGRLRMRLESR
jgi:hypothetical protein